MKIAGLILREHNGEYFLADGKDGLRFIPKRRVNFQPGDMVEAVGFLELGGLSPVLREAVARRTGRGKLPEPELLEPDGLLNRRFDSTLVKVRARLFEIEHNVSDHMLQMHAGTRAFSTGWTVATAPCRNSCLAVSWN